MATNQYERAVIEAARLFAKRGDSDFNSGLFDALEALDAYHASAEPRVTERGWHEVAEGDHLKSVKNGRFYPVVRVLKVRKGYEVTLRLPSGEVTVTRPTAAEPSATVRRGPTGDVVDVLTHVFSSGGK